jgi:hypothetical protein
VSDKFVFIRRLGLLNPKLPVARERYQQYFNIALNKMKLQMKVNFKSQIQNLGALILMTIFYYALIVYVERNLLQKWYWHLPVIIVLIPTIAVHISYLLENYNDEYEVDKKQITDKNKKVKYEANSIYKIVVYKYESLPSGIHFLPFHNYQYCKVILKNGGSFIMTSLLKYKIEEFLKQTLEGVVFEKKYKYLPSL